MASQVFLFLAIALFAASLSQADAVRTAYYCAGATTDTCTVGTSDAEASAEWKCCTKVSYSLGHPISRLKSEMMCCRASTSALRTGYCTNDYAKHYCHQTDKYCCPSKHSSLGSYHRGCCSVVTSCKYDLGVGLFGSTGTHLCEGKSSHCCPKYVGGGRCDTDSSTCCTSEGCSGSKFGGRGNNSLLLCAVSIATVVIFISMAIIPLPMMISRKTN